MESRSAIIESLFLQVSRILDAMKKLISNPVFQTSSVAFKTLNVLHK